MEVASSSKKLGSIYPSTRCCIPEDLNLHPQLHILPPYKLFMYLIMFVVALIILVMKFNELVEQLGRIRINFVGSLVGYIFFRHKNNTVV
jgi:hypothetical protein